MRKSWGILGIMAALLSACSSGSNRAPVVVAPPQTTPTFRAPQVMRETGLASVIGESAAALSRRFGKARIDLSEGDARKLQYISGGCVLDIYLYPLATGSAPVATHVEARQRAGGDPTDKARCIADVAQTASR